MMPQFDSSELNRLLALELSEGEYHSPEDALLAGPKILRESRGFQTQLADHLASVSHGRAFVLEGDAASGAFLDAIDDEVDAEIRDQSSFKK
jgi:hypothetical protein